MIRYYLSAVLVLGLAACQTAQQLTGVGFKDYAVSKELKRDSVVLSMLKNYRDSVDKNMDEVMAMSSAELLKELPNSTLGNFLADAYLWGASKYSNKQVDVAFMNHGGIRVNRMPAGKITRRHIFEVMPFDNALVLIEVKGNVLNNYLNFLAADGGGGGVAGLTYRIQDKQAVDILINGKPLDLDRTYLMANSDYAVDGGGGFTAFKQMSQNRTNYLQRDVILDYCKMHLSQGKPVVVADPKRILK